MIQVKVFETGCAQWVQIENTDVRYTSDPHAATLFDIRGLIGANEFYSDFNQYRQTLRAVPVNSNAMSSECYTVAEYIRGQRNLCDYQSHGLGIDLL